MSSMMYAMISVTLYALAALLVPKFNQSNIGLVSHCVPPRDAKAKANCFRTQEGQLCIREGIGHHSAKGYLTPGSKGR